MVSVAISQSPIVSIIPKQVFRLHTDFKFVNVVIVQGYIIAVSEQVVAKVEYDKTTEICAPCMGPLLSQNNN